MGKIVVLLDNVRSALNVGSILRTSDGAGIDMVVTAGITPSAEHIKVKKTALGAEESVATVHVKDALEEVKIYKKNEFKIFSIEETVGAKDLYDYDIDTNTDILFIFGNEITGVDPNIMNISDAVLKVPMNGKKNSLNVAITTAVILYHINYRKYLNEDRS